MITIEGADKLGKTHLAHAIIKEANSRGMFPAIYGHFSKLPKTWDAMEDYPRFIAPWVVMDRFYMSDVVYRQIDGEPTTLDPETCRRLERCLLDYGHVSIVLVSDSNWWLERQWAKSDRPELYSCEHVLKVNQAYCDLVASGGRSMAGHQMRIDYVFTVDALRGYASDEREKIIRIVDTWHGRLLSCGWKPRK
jgi:thymidylate kinase